MKTLTCIICPKGCRITEDNGRIIGNRCERGLLYAKDELSAPLRTLTHIVHLKGGMHPCIPVKTQGQIPKEKMQEAALFLEGITVSSPISQGEVIVKNILNTGIDVIATRNM